jgi:hypothetical protein
LLAKKEHRMTEQLSLTAEERDVLAEVLATALKNTQVEEHRTRAPGYREHIVRREEVLRSILGKLNRSPTPTHA